ncbi:MAG: hypothetical protein ACRD1L_06915 [Terriglobales bacterium]
MQHRGMLTTHKTVAILLLPWLWIGLAGQTAAPKPVLASPHFAAAGQPAHPSVAAAPLAAANPRPAAMPAPTPAPGALSKKRKWAIALVAAGAALAIFAIAHHHKVLCIDCVP